MQQIDTAAIATIGIPRLLLMEHAGLAVARATRRLLPAPGSAPVLICCGTGYNGGDGLCAARHLHDWGYPLSVLLTGRLADLREEPRTYATILQGLGIRIAACPSSQDVGHLQASFAQCALLIDALLGIGARGSVREPAASVIVRANASGRPILAVDIPSGLDGDTGEVRGLAIRATMTVTFGLAKRGCLTGEGPRHTGSLVVEAITIPRALLTTETP